MKPRDSINRLLRRTPYEIVRRQEKFPSEDPFNDLLRVAPVDSFRLIFDVGANSGQTLAKLAAYFPAAAIHCFEPLPDTFALLQATARPYPQAVLVNSALSDTSGKVRFFKGQTDQMHSLLPPSDCGVVRQTGLADVEQTTLDDYCQSKGIASVDLLKIDVQGAELKVLQGARGLLGRKAFRAIFLEIIASPTYVGQADFGELWTVLRGYGYRFVSLYDLTANADHSLAWCDALFIA